MAASVYTYTSDSSGDVGAITTAQGVVNLGQSGLFQPSEVQAATAAGCVLVSGPATSPASQLTAPGVGAGSAGNPNGAYRYAVTFVTAAGETQIGPETTFTLTNQQGSLTGIPVGSATSGVTARKIYRTVAGGGSGTEKLVATISDNTTTTFTDNVADGSLGANAPTSDTSAVVGGSGNSAPVPPTVTGSRGGNAALASLLTALSSKGIVNDNSTA